MKDTDASHSGHEDSTHAGGVVYRRDGAAVQYLIVTASGTGDEWVLPKGSIKPGERPEETARREVREEAGVEATVGPALGVVEIGDRGRSHFFLVEAVEQHPSSEPRKVRWATREEAIWLLAFPRYRQLIHRAARYIDPDGRRGS